MGQVEPAGTTSQEPGPPPAYFEEMAAEADRNRKLDFEEIQIPPGPRLGTQVVEVSNLTKGFDDRTLIEDLSFSLPQGGIVGVIGPNGVGKTTLFKMVVVRSSYDRARSRSARRSRSLRGPVTRQDRPG